MAIESGTKLGGFEIVGLLGVGGMGEVYRARDTKLGREVAIKVLPEAVAADAERMARFEREAQMLASLDHPNIGTLYDFRHAVPEAGEIPESGDSPVSASPRLGQSPLSGDVHFLVMQLVEGETLSERLARGRMSVEEAVPIFVQIAQALEAAHERGIVHRDLKPANIKLTDGDRVKVLDFGLAKSFLDEEPTGATPTPSGPDATTLPATPSPPRSITGTAMLVGTPSYMSPEQARGKRVDKRTDIWAFGCVLYEALSGRKAYEGETIADTVSAIIHKEVDWDALPGDTPQAMQSLLERCVRKDLNKRARDIGDVRNQLEETLSAPAGFAASSMSSASRRSSALAAVLALAAGIAIGLGAAVSVRGPGDETVAKEEGPRPVRRMNIPLLEGEPLANPARFGESLVLSPDGQRLLYVGERGANTGEPTIYMRSVDQFGFEAVPSTHNGRNPFFSPDGRWIGFFTYPEGKLKKVSVLGGPAMTLCDAPQPRGATWTPNDTIIYSTSIEAGFQLMEIPAAGGAPRVLMAPDAEKDEVGYRWPRMLPDGRNLLFAIDYGDAPARDVIAVLSLENREYRPLELQGVAPRYAASGHIVAALEGVLLAAPFDLDTLTIGGELAPVLERVQTGDAASGRADYTFSQDGLLVYAPAGLAERGKTGLAWAAADGTAEPLSMPARSYSSISLSPDAQRIAMCLFRNEGGGLWVYDVSRGTNTRLVFDELVSNGIWHPNGEEIFYAGHVGGKNLSFRVRVDGTKDPEVVYEGPHGHLTESVSPDGRYLLVSELAPNTSSDILVVDLEGVEETRAFARTRFFEANPEISPDGQWIAYASNESGRFEIYVRPFSGTGGKRQISLEGGSVAIWGRDGKSLYFQDPEIGIFAVEVETDGGFRASTPELVFEEAVPIIRRMPFDVAPDGRLLVQLPTAESELIGDLHVVENWFEELKRLVPAGKGK